MKHQKNFIINDIKVAPGETKQINLDVARLHSGTHIDLLVHAYRSAKPGPVILVLGGVHGDEVNGIEIVRRLIANKHFNNLLCGSVIAIPLLNIYGFLNFSRDLPDGKDVNRSFPGNKNGSLASRVAHVLSDEILPWIDFGLDFHTGGSTRYNFPQIRYSPSDEKAIELAKIFAPPYLIPSHPIDKSLRKVAQERGTPFLVYEGGESLRIEDFSIKEGIKGTLRVLHAHKMIKEAPPVAFPTVTLPKKRWIRASKSGMFRWLRQSGDSVVEGETLGIISDPYGYSEAIVTSTQTGILFGHNNASVVNQGDALFHVGYK